MITMSDLRCIKLRPHDKRPIEKEWQLSKNQYTYEQIQPWLKSGNFGIVCGVHDLAVLDIDNVQRVAELDIRPYYETFTIKTGSGGYHFYYEIPGARPLTFKDAEGNHLGELRYTGQFVVGPLCIHPNGNQYEIYNEAPISDKITYQDILDLFDSKATISGAKKEEAKYTGPIQEEAPFQVTDIWSIAGFERNDKGNYLGPHPVHGSKTGHNLSINPATNTWKCFRHETGGGPIQALAVDAGIIDCSECTKGAIRGKTWNKVCLEARRRGLI
jgi:hypothetical protein